MRMSGRFFFLCLFAEREERRSYRYVGDKQLNVSPTVSARRFARLSIDLLTADDKSMMNGMWYYGGVRDAIQCDAVQS